MDHDRLSKLSAFYQHAHTPEKEKEMLLAQYLQNPADTFAVSRLSELGILDGSVLLADAEGIFDFQWTEGFGATIFTLVTRLEYCLENKLYFSLNTPLGFGYWADYFKPFWNEERKKNIHARISNVITKQPRLSIYSEQIKGFREKNNHNLFSKGQYLHMLKTVYQLKDEIQAKVDAAIQAFNFPSDYIAVHIRRGDRQMHRRCPCRVDIREYLNAIAHYRKQANRVFVMSDDSQLVQEISKHIQVDTLTSATQRGFDHKTFFSTTHEGKVDTFIQLFTEIEIASRAKHFVGTYCSVLSHLIQARHGVGGTMMLY